MSEKILTSLVTVATAIIGVAILAVLVSKQSQTSQVIGAAGSAFAQDLGAALSPITGGSSSLFSTGGLFGNNGLSGILGNTFSN